MTLLGHRVFCFIVFPALATLVPTQTAAQSLAPVEISLATDDRVRSPGWWPTKGSAPRSAFSSTAECAKCHEKQALTHINTPMAQASAPAAYSQILPSHDSLSAELPPYRYELSRTSATVNYSVTDGSTPLSTLVAWAFGLGHKGQTYLYQPESGRRDANQRKADQREVGPRPTPFYESRLSFYRTLQGLDLTTGHNTATPEDLESALGRRMDADETRRCFACHTTASTTSNRFDPTHVTPGVTCEACHGPGAKHVAAMKAGKIEDGRRAILNPRRLSPVASVDFCGACHRTWADVLQGGFTGFINARFQPYRLESSRCWQALKGDARLACTACHDAHQQLDPDPASYDQSCLACHAAGPGANSAGDRRTTPGAKLQSDHPGAACSVSTKNCISCHMPQVELPSMHSAFTDHRIRIARPGEPYPN